VATLDYPEKIPNTRDGQGDSKTKELAEYYGRIGQWCNAAYDEASAQQNLSPELKSMSQAFEYLNGNQWTESMPSYRAKPVSNEFAALYWECIGLLTDTKPMFKITDIAKDGEFSKTEKILNACARGWAQQSKFERKLAFTTMFAMLTSAPAKIYWNPFARGHSGDAIDGDISYDYFPIQNLLRLGVNSYDDIQQDECIIYSRSRTLNWIKRAFPRMGKLVKPEEQISKYTSPGSAGINVAPNFYPNLSAGMRRLMGTSEPTTAESVYPKAIVREFWLKEDTRNESKGSIWMGPRNMAWCYEVKPGEMMYPRGRLIIRSNDITLYDEPNPYFHRKFPFALMGLNAVPWQMYAMSVVGPWMKQQDILNQIMQGVLMCIKKATNPALMAAKSAIHPEALRAIDSSKTNLKISYSQNAPSPPSWQTPPNVPGYVFQGYTTILTSMKQASVGTAMDNAGTKKQMPGGDTMDKIAFSKTTPIRNMGRNIEDFNNDVGNLWAPTACQFYDAGRRIEMLGIAGGLAPEDMDDKVTSLIPEGQDSEAFVRRWRYETDRGTMLGVERSDRTQVAFALRKNHDLSRKQLFKQLDWNINQKENDEELQAEAEAMAKAQAAAGVKPGAHKK